MSKDMKRRSREKKLKARREKELRVEIDQLVKKAAKIRQENLENPLANFYKHKDPTVKAVTVISANQTFNYKAEVAPDEHRFDLKKPLFDDYIN